MDNLLKCKLKQVWWAKGNECNFLAYENANIESIQQVHCITSTTIVAYNIVK